MSGPLPEPQVHSVTSRPLWIALIAGPSLWFGHFMAVYLLTEAVCAAASTSLGVGSTWLEAGALGLSLLSVVVLVITVVAIGVVGWAMVATRSYDRQEPADTGRVMAIGLWLDVLFVVAILFVGLPAMVLSPC